VRHKTTTKTHRHAPTRVAGCATPGAWQNYWIVTEAQIKRV